MPGRRPALLARAIEGLEPAGEFQVARFTLEILRPIPLTALQIEARVVRPGRRVQFAEATLRTRAGRWPGPVCGGFAQPMSRVPQPARSRHRSIPPSTHRRFRCSILPWEGGESYFAAMEWRVARGAFFEPGPAAAWVRARIPLVQGEETSPLGRVLIVADSGNGISSVTSPLEYLLHQYGAERPPVPSARWRVAVPRRRVADRAEWRGDGREHPLGRGRPHRVVATRACWSRRAIVSWPRVASSGSRSRTR